jgi:glyoxylase-like metal-dependent hydrolase (beta-lactamase superfamily II)
MEVHAFTFNVFSENTYVLAESGECIIVDPGCSTDEERSELLIFLEERKLKPVMLLNTHGHIDHIPGNAFLHREFGLRPLIHALEVPVMEAAPQFGRMFGMPCEPSPAPERVLEEGELIKLGTEELRCIFTPGHSPGSLSFYSEKSGFVLSGDVLFRGGIGRFDLPGADKNQLKQSLEKLMQLPEETMVWSGHGPETTIGREKRKNPYVLSPDSW